MRASSLDIQNGAAKLTGDLTFATVTALYERMQDLSTDNGMPRSIDMSGVDKIDSAGLALLLEWQSEFRKPGRSSGLMQIRNPPPALLKIARLCDAGEFLGDDKNPRKEQ